MKLDLPPQVGLAADEIDDDGVLGRRQQRAEDDFAGSVIAPHGVDCDPGGRFDDRAGARAAHEPALRPGP